MLNQVSASVFGWCLKDHLSFRLEKNIITSVLNILSLKSLQGIKGRYKLAVGIWV